MKKWWVMVHRKWGGELFSVFGDEVELDEDSPALEVVRVSADGRLVAVVFKAQSVHLHPRFLEEESKCGTTPEP